MVGLVCEWSTWMPVRSSGGVGERRAAVGGRVREAECEPGPDAEFREDVVVAEEPVSDHCSLFPLNCSQILKGERKMRDLPRVDISLVYLCNGRSACLSSLS